MGVVIYGAGSIALGLCEALNVLYPEHKPEYFMVSDKSGNPDILCGIPVFELDKMTLLLTYEDRKELEVLIATPEDVMDEIEQKLRDGGYKKMRRITSRMWGSIMEEKFKIDGNADNLGTIKPLGSFDKSEADVNNVKDASDVNDKDDVNDKEIVSVYMAKHQKDRGLTGEYELPGWVYSIQVGAALSDVKIADISDDNGDNISNKNPNYSELTALYRVWKKLSKEGTQDDKMPLYSGIAHYRRLLHITDEDVKKLRENDIDVVLPYPMPYEPDIGEHHRKYLSDEDWQAVLKAVEKVSPEIYDKMQSIFEGRYFYNYNIFIAKKDVINDYCSWLFAVLKEVEELSMPKASDRADRYIGYIGESLATLYFATKKDELNIYHTWCDFMV